MIFSLAAVALPLTSSFVGEFLIIIGAWKSFPQWALVASVGVVLGAIYTLTAYMRTMFGVAGETVPLKRSDIRGVDALVMGALAVMVIALGVFPGRVLSVIEPAVTLRLAQARVESGRAAPRGEIFQSEQGKSGAESVLGVVGHSVNKDTVNSEL
jgi:NADH-quinone oxidoreductase subunit M